MKKIILSLICFIVLFISCKEYNESQDTFDTTEISNSEYDENDYENNEVNSNQTDNYTVTNEPQQQDAIVVNENEEIPTATNPPKHKALQGGLNYANDLFSKPTSSTISKITVDKDDYKDYVNTDIVTNIDALDKAKAANQTTIEKVKDIIIDKKN